MTVDARRDRHPLTFTKVRGRDDTKRYRRTVLRYSFSVITSGLPRARDDSGGGLPISNFCLEYWSLEFDWILVIGAWKFM